jgi:hypothetical protein
MKQAGITFNLAGILKQSQLFTGMVGSIFQIAGAAVDIFLAAFMPILIPAIRMVADLLPLWKSAVDATLGRLIELIVSMMSWFGDKLDALKSPVEGVLQTLGVNEDTSKAIANNVLSLGTLVITPMALLAMKKFGILGKSIGLVKAGVAGLKRGILRIPGMANGLKWLSETGFGKAVASGMTRVKGLFGAGGAIKGVGKSIKTSRVGSMFGGLGKFSKVGKLGGKIFAKGLLPGLSTIMIAGETLVDTYKNFKEVRAAGGGLGKALAIGGLTLGTGAAAAALSVASPTAGMIAHEGSKIAMNAVTREWGGVKDRGTLDGTMLGLGRDIVVNVAGMTQSAVDAQNSIESGDANFKEIIAVNPTK